MRILPLILLFCVFTVAAAEFPEHEADDVRISVTAPAADAGAWALAPAAVYNPDTGEALVVWFAETTDNSGIELFARRVSLATGDTVGEPFQLTEAGTPGDPERWVNAVGVQFDLAYDASLRRYVLVYGADDDRFGLANDKFEIFIMQLDGISGLPVTDPVRVSFTAVGCGADCGDDKPWFDAYRPKLAVDPAGGYMVAWGAGSPSLGLADDEFEIFGRRVDRDLNLLEEGARRLTEVQPDGSETGEGSAALLSVLFNPVLDEYLLLWLAADHAFGLGGAHREVFFRRLATDTLLPVSDSERLSFSGGDLVFYSASFTDAVYNPERNEFFVTWSARVDDYLGREIYGRQLDAKSMTPMGDARRLSFTLPDSRTPHPDPLPPEEGDLYTATTPSVTWSAALQRYVVTWNADQGVDGWVDGDREVLAALVDPDTGVVDAGPWVVSAMGERGNIAHYATASWAVADPASGRSLVVWEGNEPRDGLSGSKVEIFGQAMDFAYADLAVMDMTVTSAAVDAGTPVTVSVDIRNEGIATAPAARLVRSADDDILPLLSVSVQRLAENESVQDCQPDDKANTCIVADIGSGESYRVTYEFDTGGVPATAEFEFAVELSATTFDPDVSNNALATKFTVRAAPEPPPAAPDPGGGGGGSLGWLTLLSLWAARRGMPDR